MGIIGSKAKLSRHRTGFDPYPILRSSWQKHQRISYVVSGSVQHMILELVSDSGSPFFQHFDVMELGTFSHEAAAELLIEAAPSPKAISPELADHITQIVGNHPFYVQLVGEIMVNEKEPWNRDTFKIALQKLVRLIRFVISNG